MDTLEKSIKQKYSKKFETSVWVLIDRGKSRFILIQNIGQIFN